MHFFHSKKIKQLSVPASTNVIKCNIPVNFPISLFLVDTGALAQVGPSVVSFKFDTFYSSCFKYQSLTVKSRKVTADPVKYYLGHFCVESCEFLDALVTR